jgi:flagellar basal-body rod modification protein FlgD
MTTVDNSVSASLLATMNPQTSGAAKDANSATATQDRFMTLLVTQLKNQDPLNPMDNAAVTSQMAQLSTVTGINQMNTTLQSLISSVQSTQSVQASGLIGHGVLAPGSGIDLASGSAQFGVQLTSAVDAMQITVRDASGNPVHTVTMGKQDVGTVALQWDGKTDSGTTAPDGHYTFDVTATSGGQKSTAFSTLSYGKVTSVSTGGTGVTLTVPGIGTVKQTDVAQIL